MIPDFVCGDRRTIWPNDAHRAEAASGGVTIAGSGQVARGGSHGLVAQCAGLRRPPSAFWGWKDAITCGWFRARKGNCGVQSRPTRRGSRRPRNEHGASRSAQRNRRRCAIRAAVARTRAGAGPTGAPLHAAAVDQRPPRAVIVASAPRSRGSVSAARRCPFVRTRGSSAVSYWLFSACSSSPGCGRSASRLAQRPGDRHRLDRVHPDRLRELPPVRHHRDPRVPAARRRRPRLPPDRLPPWGCCSFSGTVALAPVARRQARPRRVLSARSCWSGPRARSPRSASELRRTPSAGYLVVGACVPLGDPRGERAAAPTSRSSARLGRLEALAAVRADTVADHEHRRTAARRGQAHLVAARGGSAAPRARAQPHRRRRPAHPHPAGRRASPDPRRDAPVQQGSALRQARIRLLCPWSALIAAVARSWRSSPRHQARRARDRSSSGRCGSAWRRRVPDAEVPLDGRNAEELLPDLEQRSATRQRGAVQDEDDPRVTPSAGSCAATASTSCRSCSTCSAARCRSWVRARRCAARSRVRRPRAPPVAGQARHHRAVAGQRPLRPSWEESVRLDLSYVENWSLIGDVVILLKTAKAALAPGNTACLIPAGRAPRYCVSAVGPTGLC